MKHSRKVLPFNHYGGERQADRSKTGRIQKRGVEVPSQGNTESTLNVGVRAPLLDNWLGERWVSRCIRVDTYDLSMSQVQQIVDSLLPDVPVQLRKKLPEDGFELLVVDRDAFALELAREWVRSGLPRTTVR